MSDWQKPSIYSCAVIVTVLGLIGFLAHAGRLSITESTVAALLGVLTWSTKGLRPDAADKIGGGPPAASLLLLACALSLTHCFPVDKSLEADVAYKAQVGACIDRNDTRAAIDACRDKVKANWAADAGADARADAGGEGGSK